MKKKVLSERIKVIGGLKYPVNRLKIINLLNHIQTYKIDFGKMPGRTLGGCKIRKWNDKIILVRWSNKEIPNTQIPLWGNLIYDGRWEVKAKQNMRIFYPNSDSALLLRKKFDVNKKLPWEIWKTIPINLKIKIKLDYGFDLDEHSIDSHLLSSNKFFNTIKPKDDFNIRFLTKQ